jgi:hypothetical protein
MLIIVVILWVLLGLGVFFIAMHRGPRGARCGSGSWRCSPSA